MIALAVERAQDHSRGLGNKNCGAAVTAPGVSTKNSRHAGLIDRDHKARSFRFTKTKLVRS